MSSQVQNEGVIEQEEAAAIVQQKHHWMWGMADMLQHGMSCCVMGA